MIYHIYHTLLISSTKKEAGEVVFAVSWRVIADFDPCNFLKNMVYLDNSGEQRCQVAEVVHEL